MSGGLTFLQLVDYECGAEGGIPLGEFCLMSGGVAEGGNVQEI